MASTIPQRSTRRLIAPSRADSEGRECRWDRARRCCPGFVRRSDRKWQRLPSLPRVMWASLSRNDLPLGVGIGDDGRAGVTWWPIGLVRAVMPCDFLPSQMSCATVSILPTGNDLVLKHPDSVQPCAQPSRAPSPAIGHGKFQPAGDGDPCRRGQRCDRAAGYRRVRASSINGRKYPHDGNTVQNHHPPLPQFSPRWTPTRRSCRPMPRNMACHQQARRCARSPFALSSHTRPKQRHHRRPRPSRRLTGSGHTRRQSL